MSPRLHLPRVLCCLGSSISIFLFIPLILELERNIDKTNALSGMRDEGPKKEDNHNTTHINNKTDVSSVLPSCPETPPLLRGHLGNIDVNNPPLRLGLSIYYGGEVEVGGTWRPKECKARKKVAFIIPFRKRWEQLNTFLNHMHPLFQRQQLDYRIFLVEQAGKEMFNKGAIYNIGFNESLKFDDYDCFVFHDIDLLSETDTNNYGCPNSPMHLSVGIDIFHYKLPYYSLIGGIQLFSKEHYIMVNGYSNKFWGWGGEDDNLYSRIISKGIKLIRPPVEIARYKMNGKKHFRSDKWNRLNALQINKPHTRLDVDGLNQVNKLNFTLTTKETLLFTFISIDLHRTKEV